MLKFYFLLSLAVSILSLNCNYKKIPSFEFERLTFHALGNGCEGYCSTFHMQIDSSKNLLFYGEIVYKSVDSLEEIPLANKTNKTKYQKSFYRLIDNSRTGYFTGKVPVSLYRELIQQLKAINLDSLKTDGNRCCDGIHKKLTIFYNEKYKYWEATFPEDNVENIFRVLYKIAEGSKLKKSKSGFNIN